MYPGLKDVTKLYLNRFSNVVRNHEIARTVIHRLEKCVPQTM